VLWTDQPVLALYAQRYNARQSRYIVNVKYIDTPAARLIARSDAPPDMALASYLNSPMVIKRFTRLDFMLSSPSAAEPPSDEELDRRAFYAPLLALGLDGEKQRLLPVSFNLPLVVFKAGDAPTAMLYELDALRKASEAYNQYEQGTNNYISKGFSPLWGTGNDFLLVAAQLAGADFRQTLSGGTFSHRSRIEWNEARLDNAVAYLHSWVTANGGTQAEDEFIYKYFFNPPSVLLASGRIRFAYMASDAYFMLGEQAAVGLDYRYLAASGRTPAREDVALFGIVAGSRAKQACVDFARWLFTTTTQRELLEMLKATWASERSFGIAGGFSALKQVSEVAFPQYYNGLLGHTPPGNALAVSMPLPAMWKAVATGLVLPCLRAGVRGDATRPLRALVDDWQRQQRDTFN
jgi:hypothetical protein